MFNYGSNNRRISEVYEMFEGGKLSIDTSYQRRSVWGEKDKVRLIETILLKFIVPELFFWKASTNPETGGTLTHIVDGQQRINALVDFIDGRFKLKTKHLENNEIIQNYGDLFFNELPADIKTSIWDYKLMIIDIDTNATRNEIVEMFRRLNLTEYSLNSQERRHGIAGDFATLANEISDLDVWFKYKLFNASDIKRMRDVEFCASLVLLYKKGIIDQSTQSALNEAYEEFRVDYEGKEQDKDDILKAVNLLTNFFTSKDAERFLRRKTQLYTIFSVIFFMLREEVVLNDKIIVNFDNFTKIYNVFRNELNLEGDLTSSEKDIFDNLKKYKLASSEGINKAVNRNIRYNVLRKFLFDENSDWDAESSLLNKMNNKMIEIDITDDDDVEENEEY